MATLTITIDDDTFARLVERAEEVDSDAATVATALVTSCLAPERESEVSPEVAAIIARQVEEFRPLFRRLAQ
ncbi:MAG TPA: hypothetical protein PJ994_12215 [Tepidiformaceae bacterium]|nr:hypothetical protein [Tepidiformaceae bacterium]